jgi:hypothetical protein
VLGLDGHAGLRALLGILHFPIAKQIRSNREASR